MPNITVSSLPIHQVVQDIARELNTSFHETTNFYKVNIPSKVGYGQISGIDFGGGFGLLNYDCCFHKKTTIRFTLQEVHPMKFIHCKEGKFTHTFELDNELHEVETYENIIVASSQKNGHILEFEASQKVQICSIEIDRNKFLPKLEKLKPQNTSKLSRVLMDNYSKDEFYFKGYYSLVIHNIITDLLEGRETELADLFFKEGKSYEMLALQWDQFYIDKSKLALNRKISLNDFNLLEMITNYIEGNIEDSITLKILEKEFATNEKRIQFLFKLGYHTTFNSYLQNIRLEKAIELLKDSNNNISDVVYAVGLTNKSYFSKIFKEKFGTTPSQFVKELESEKAEK